MSTLPGGTESAAPSLEPGKSRPPRWAIWLPAGLTVTLILLAALAFMALGNRIEEERAELANVVEPANRKIIEFLLTFEGNAALSRSYAALPRAETLERMREMHARAMRALFDIKPFTRTIGPEFEQLYNELHFMVASWEVQHLQLMAGELTPEMFRSQLPVRDELVRDVVLKATALDAAGSQHAQALLQDMKKREQRRLLVLASIIPFALLSAVLTAWFGEKARRLNQRLVRNAAEEALLRDAMAALTHTDVLPEALDRIAAIAMRVGEANAAFIEQCDDARSTVTVVASAGRVAPSVGVRDPYVGSITNEVVRSGQPRAIEDLSTFGSAIGGLIGERCGRCPGLAVPLHRDGDVDGVLILMNRSGRGSVALEDLIPRIWILGALAALALRRQLLSAQLEAERARLNAVVAEMPAGVILAEAPSGRITMINRQAIEIWRGHVRPPESIDDYDEWRCLYPDGRAYLAEEFPLARSIRMGELVSAEEAEIERADGSRSVVRFSSAPIRDTRGEIVAGVITAYDISEQKRREQANQFLDEVSRVLAASLDYDATLHALLQLSVPRLADFAIVHLRVGEEKATRRFESTPADTETRELLETIDRKYPVSLTGHHPSGVAIRTGKAQLRTTVSDELLEKIADDQEHLRLLRRLGMQSAMAAPLIVRGRTLGALLLVSQDRARRYGPRDLALAEELARRAALAVDNAELFRTVSENEKRARFLADAAQAFAGSLDYEETIRRVVRLAVPFFADLTVAFLTDAQGVTQHVEVAHRDPQSEVLLEKAAPLYRPGPNNLASTVTRAVRSGQAVLVKDVTREFVEHLHFDSEVREIFDTLGLVSWVSAPLQAGETKLGAIVFGFAESGRHYGPDDVSLAQLIASRAALAMQNALLFRETQEALHTRDEVLAIVSHDLRNPLHTISTSAELLIEVPVDEEKRRHHLEVISQAGQRMERLIRDLLDVARIEAGKTLIIDPMRESASELLREACDSFAVLAREKNLRLECNIPAELPDIMADHGRILQVLANLMSNALKFTPESGLVEVSAQQENGTVKVSVRDTGPGIRPEERENIFLPFWQAMRVGRSGAGLGLTIARAIIEQHNGRIWVECPPGTGCVFCFTVPVADKEEKRAA